MDKLSFTRKILLADDDIDDRVVFNEALGEIDIPTSLIMVQDGEELLHYLVKNTDNLPQVLFLDLNMPRKNGHECLLEIRRNPLLKELPVIIFSTFYEKEKIMELFANGAHYYVRKPSDFTELKKILSRVITLVLHSDYRPSRENFVISQPGVPL